MSEHPLAKLDKARQILATSKTLPEVLKIRDMAEAAKVYAQAAHLGRETQNYAAEIALLASRKAGEILSQLEKKPGGRTDLRQTLPEVSESAYSKTLKETNTPTKTAMYWQKLARIPQEIFIKYIMETAIKGEISSTGLLKAQPHSEKRKNRSEPVKDFEDLRKLAIRMLNIGYEHLKKDGEDASHLDSAKNWARIKLEE